MKQNFKGIQLRKYRVVHNILKHYDMSTEDERQRGLVWYENARTFCQHLADGSGLPLEKVIGIVAALSPQNSWDINKAMAATFIMRKGKGRVKNRVCDGKAKAIYLTDDLGSIESLLGKYDNSALKTKSFYKNILNPGCIETVTIDRHAINVCRQSPDNVKANDNSVYKLTENQYNFFTKCYRSAANKLGISPSSLQAIVWESYRRLRGLRVHSEWKSININVEF